MYYDAIVNSIGSLAYNPRPFGSVKLKGYSNTYRIRIGVYRVVYSIEDNILRVEVIKIDHRNNIFTGSVVGRLLPTPIVDFHLQVIGHAPKTPPPTHSCRQRCF
jgi:mRNA interferase RelE/StbE